MNVRQVLVVCVPSWQRLASIIKNSQDFGMNIDDQPCRLAHLAKRKPKKTPNFQATSSD